MLLEASAGGLDPAQDFDELAHAYNELTFVFNPILVLY